MVMRVIKSVSLAIILILNPFTILGSQNQSLGNSKGSEIRGIIFADNYFELFINGKLIVKDPIEFTPHNVVSVEFTAQYPMVIAVKVKDFADPKTGLEYNNTRIGDGGFILKFSDGTVTDDNWKAKKVFWGPLDPSCLYNDPANNCKVALEDIPENWYAVDFDDSAWPNAFLFTENQVNPHGDYYGYDWRGARFIWTQDLELDNTILFRYRVNKRK